MRTDTATRCPVPGHNDTVTRQGAVVCARAWSGVTRMCRGKWRLDQYKAEWIQSNRPTALAYRCAVCAHWHNGRSNSQHEQLQEVVRDTIDILIRARGEDWFAQLLHDFDPANGIHQRTPVEAR